MAEKEKCKSSENCSHNTSGRSLDKPCSISFPPMPNKNIEEKVEEFAEKFVKVPCECPKGGRIGENEYICPKCDGTEWVADPKISEWLRKALLSVRDEALREAEADKKELYDALQDMFDQYCPDGDHGYISAGENAEIVLNKFASLSTNKE